MAKEKTDKKEKKEKKEKKDGGSKNAIIIAVAILLGFKFFGGSSGSAPVPLDAAAAAHGEGDEMDCTTDDITNPKHGHGVLELDPMNINLAENHYLRVTVGLELAEGANMELYKEENLGAKAADVVIALTGGRSMAEFATPEDIEILKEQLTEKIRPMYECEVTAVLFKEFVMQ